MVEMQNENAYYTVKLDLYYRVKLDLWLLNPRLGSEYEQNFIVQVARRANVIEDIAVIQEVRRKVGDQVELRVDANRNWTYDEAIQFANSVKNCRLQYIEVSPPMYVCM